MDRNAATRISRQIAIAASAKSIFDALTQPKQLAKWWGNERLYKWTKIEHDLRVQGTWEMSGLDAKGKPLFVKGVYRSIEAPFEFEQAWAYDFSQSGFHESTVHYSLKEYEGVTRLCMTHTGFRPDDRRSLSEGWARVLGWLRKYAEQATVQSGG